jgi:hypothetical protein
MNGKIVKLNNGLGGECKVLYRMPTKDPMIQKHLRGKYCVMLMSTGRIEYVTKKDMVV